MRHPVALIVVLLSVVLAWCACAFALDPSLDISQYAHTAWKIREGFTKGQTFSITQTPDGYLWLGTEFGLLRFDGVRTVPFQPPRDQHLPSVSIVGLLTAHDGTLWIGTLKGLVSWKDGKLAEYPELDGQDVFTLFEDRDGTIWAGSFGIPTGRLCAIQSHGIHCYGEDGTLGMGVFGLYEDSKGNVWVGVSNGLWNWGPGGSKFYPMPGNPDGIQAFSEGDDSALLIGTRRGIKRFADGEMKDSSLSGVMQQQWARKMLRDRDGSIWIGTNEPGLVHVHNGKTDVFAQSSGLSGNLINAVFEDREGNIWVATSSGLDRFHEFVVATASTGQGLSDLVVGSVLAASDGSIWLGTQAGLNRWDKGQIAIASTGSIKRDGKLNGNIPNTLFQDRQGRIWVSTVREFGYLENQRFVPISGIPGGYVHSIAQDNEGNLWIANQQAGLLRLSPRGDVERIPWGGLGHADHANALLADPSKDGLWLGFYNGGVSYFADGGLRASYSTGNGLGGGHVYDLQVDQQGALWAATEGGLSRLKDGRVATLTSNQGLPCDVVHWSIEDDDHSIWLYTACGLVRIARSELDAWAASTEDKGAKRTIHASVFDNSDGVRINALAGGFNPRVSKSLDGKLWFTAYDGVNVIDPHHLAFNKLPPPVHVEEIVGDQKTYAAAPGLRLPPRLRDLQIDYTALSLVAPEKVFFRYKLDGWDRDWQEAGTRRLALYSNLPPRKYRFRVMACNNSGVWNEAGATLNFVIPPAWYQTNWFRAACVVAFLTMIWGMYELRVRQLAAQFNMRLDERVNERTRIARELHDTLLQNFQGLLPRLQAAINMLPERVTESRKTLEAAVDGAEEAITEGRNAIKAMRLSTVERNDLAVAVRTLA